ncbi:DUF6429 family protein [Pseudomonas shahriarae]
MSRAGICDPVNRNKSVWLTEEGLERWVRELL